MPFEACPAHGEPCLLRCATCAVACCRACSGVNGAHVGKAHVLRAMVRGSDTPLNAGADMAIVSHSSPAAGHGSAPPGPAVDLAPGLRAFLGPFFGAEAPPLTPTPDGDGSSSRTSRTSIDLRNDLGIEASSDGALSETSDSRSED